MLPTKMYPENSLFSSPTSSIRKNRPFGHFIFLLTALVFQMDARNMSSFDDASFDGVIDKGIICISLIMIHFLLS